jgi:hypothetical protein
MNYKNIYKNNQIMSLNDLMIKYFKNNIDGY